MTYLQTFGKLALQNSSFGGPKALVLTAYLALEGPKSRAELAALLYGKHAANARDKLYALVNYLEKSTTGVIERDPERLRTRVPNDAHDLLNALHAGALEDVDALYQGYFLEGVQLDAFSSELSAWVLTQRASFAAQAREAFLTLGERAAADSFGAGARRAERAYLLHWAPEPDGEVFGRIYTLLVAGDHPLAATVQKEASTFGVTLELTRAQARQRLRLSSAPVNAPVDMLGEEDQVKRIDREGREAIPQRDRQLLAQRVRTLWLDGVLTNMVDTPLQLERELRPEATQRPWGGLVERPYANAGLAEQPLGAAFEDAGHMLLLLGDAGAGKTVSLLQLTQDLLEGAETDPAEPLPVVFKLGGWAEGMSLFDWLVRELEGWYYIPAELGQRWLRGRQLVLLLDGLDEVAPSKRRSCIAAINAFIAACGPPGFVVTSRTEAYLQAEGSLRLQAALELKPLTDDQVDDYLRRTNCSRSLILTADPYLRLLARNPAMLRVMDMASLAQDERAGERVWAHSAPNAPEAAHKQVLHSYVQKTLFRKGDETRYNDDDTLDWLAWLAHTMKRHGRSVFRLEDLQPDWLGESRRRCYYCAAGLLWGLLLFTIAALSASFVVGVPGNLLIGLVVGVFVGVREVQERRYTRLEAMNRPRWSWRGVQRTTWMFWLRWLAVTGAFGFLLTLSGGALLGESPRRLDEWLETLTGSVLFSVPFGLLVGLLEAGLRNQQLTLTPTQLDRAIPASARYMSLGSLTLAGLGALLLSPGFAYLLAAAELPTSLALAAGTFIGLGLGFWQFGGMTFVGYYVLRTVLALSNRTTRNPFDYPNFLAYASSLTFLREVGGGYEFFHGIVQDYFAARYDEDEEVREQRYAETR